MTNPPNPHNTYPDPPEADPSQLAEQAANDPLYFRELIDTAAEQQDTTKAEAARQALDGQLPPFDHDRAAKPEYRVSFHRALQEVLSVAGDSSIADQEQWEQARDEAAAKLKQALDEDPNQAVHVNVTLIKLEDNAAAAAKKSGSTNNAHKSAENDVEAAERRTFTGDPEFPAPNGVEPIAPPPPGSDVKKYYDDALAEALSNVRRRPGAKIQKDLIRGYVAECRSRALNPAFFAGKATLRQSVLMNGHDGVETMQRLHAIDKQKADRFREIVERTRAPGIVGEYDPAKLQENFGELINDAGVEDSQAYQTDLDNALLRWRQTASPTTEHDVFRLMHKNREYLRSVRAALGVVSKHDSKYAQLQKLHATISRIHNVTTYQHMLQRHENYVEDGYDFQGRYPVRFASDAGVHQEGGKEVYYPDGSTAVIDQSGHMGSRLNPNGSIHREAEKDNSGRRERVAANLRSLIGKGRLDIDPDKSTIGDLTKEYDETADSLFIEPNDSNRLKARDYARAIKRRTELALKEAKAQAAAGGTTYVEDITHRRTVNYYRYRALYHDFKPGVRLADSEAQLMPLGDIEVEDTTMYGHKGRWKLWPSGNAQQIDNLDGIMQHYNANGQRVS